MKTIVFLLFILTLAFVSCTEFSKKEVKNASPIERFIKPPIPGIDIDYSEYSIDASKGNTFFYKTGSIILFPPNSFVDKDGNLIHGNVQVKYREFSDPIDFYLSGIPMDYDSAGNKFRFESSGMCEVLAYQNGLPVFVNQKSKPEIFLSGSNNSPTHNLYYLDTAKNKWINKAASITTSLNRENREGIAKWTIPSPADSVLTPPIKPEKANNKNPVLKIVIDPASVKELLMYNNLKFQLDSSEKKFNPKDLNEEWRNVDIIKGKQRGVYIIKFSNDKKIISYVARPVFEGEDYDKAQKVFDRNNTEYNKRLKERLKKEQEQKTQYGADSLKNEKILEENDRIQRLNLLIEARNREVEKANKIVETQIKINAEATQANELYRSFQIDGFGIWNCDKAIALDCISLVAIFKDQTGNILPLTNIAVLYKSFNGILRYPGSKIQVVKNADNMIIGVHSGKFAYLSYEDFKKTVITGSTKEQTFIMTVVSEKDNNYTFIKEIAKQ